MYALIAHRGFESHSLRHLPLLNGLPLRVVWRPDEAWHAVRAAAPTWRRSLFGLVAPLALLPALLWPLGHAADPIGPEAAAGPSLAALSAITFFLCVATVAIVAAAIYGLAPHFSARRHWDGAMAVAAYSSVPVFIASPLLASATLTIVLVVAFFHGCVLCGMGLRRVLGCPGEETAMYVAAVAFVAGLAAMMLGGLSSIAGIL